MFMRQLKARVKLMLYRLVRPLNKVEFVYERVIRKSRSIVELSLLRIKTKGYGYQNASLIFHVI